MLPNGLVFYGSHWADSLGKVIRFCLSLGVTPVFTPPHETGFQAAIESYNGRWQRAVWNRFTFCNLKEIQTQSERYVNAVHEKNAKQINAAPTRWLIDEHWQLDWQTPP
ncbi:MAG: hypothetical protein LBT05_10145 [Planctomycetaceae bacterium]|nr:hypothetical protein [Planctomycetaceae bacterium]